MPDDFVPFLLSDELITKVMDAMESFKSSEAATRRALVTKELGVDIPSWTSGDGFNLREGWVETLYPSQAARALKAALHSGRGAFRTFKDILKDNPALEKHFNRYKHAKMKSVIVEWYNALRTVWGLEQLDEDIGDEDKEFDSLDLLLEDFLWCAGEDKGDGKSLIDYGESEVNLLVRTLWQEYLDHLTDRLVIKCKAGDEEAARLTLGKFSGGGLSPCCQYWAIGFLFVEKKWRGLGVATRLLNLAKDEGKKRGCTGLVMPFWTAEMEGIFIKCGWTKVTNCYILLLGGKD